MVLFGAFCIERKISNTKLMLLHKKTELFFITGLFYIVLAVDKFLCWVDLKKWSEHCNRLLRHKLVLPGISQKNFIRHFCLYGLCYDYQAWQVGSFGHFASTPAQRFESTNYLWRSKLTGTVNHLQFLVERYIRNNYTYDRKIEDNNAEFFSKLCVKMRFVKQCLNSIIPDDVRAEKDIFYSNSI